jgi:two-component system, chemotaxis family, protein-glutamate methylesterase/glutaminase
MALEHLIVIGASAGGLEAVTTIVGRLPADLPAAICIVIHMAPDSPGTLHWALNRAGTLPAEQVTSRSKLQPGRVYVAPPDYHLLIEPGVVRVGRGPKEHHFRPAVDPLFRSAAQVYGPRVIGVVLSGNLDDGTSGLWAIKKLGGVAIVQDPKEAEFPSMPRNAVAQVAVDYCVALGEIPPRLVQLTAMPVHERARQADDSLDVEVRIAGGESARDAGVQRLGPPSEFSCPECHGVLLQVQEGNRRRYRCHTGHSYSSVSLLSSLNEEVDRALWQSIRSLDETERILNHMASHHVDADPEHAHLSDEAGEAVNDAAALRSVVERRGRRGRR